MKIPLRAENAKFFFQVTLAFSMVLNVAHANVAEIDARPLGQYQTDKEIQTISFKRPIIIPFKLISKSKISDIESAKNDFDRMLTVVFVNGQIVRTSDPLTFDRTFDAEIYKTALLDEVPGGRITSENEGSIDVNYCRAVVVLSGFKNKEGYILSIRSELHPFVESQSRIVGINFGDVVKTQYMLAADLAPNERPNEATIRARSYEMPSLFCVRHSKSREGTRVQDLIKVIGPSNIKVR